MKKNNSFIGESLLHIPRLLQYDIDPKGDYCIYAASFNQNAQLYKQNLSLNEINSNPIQLTNELNPVTNVKISSSGKFCIYSKDSDGTEMENLFLLDIQTREIKKITNNSARTLGYCINNQNNNIARIIVQPTSYNVEIIDFCNQGIWFLFSSKTPLFYPQFSPDGKWLSVTQITSSNTKKIIIISLSSKQINYQYEFNNGSSQEALIWHEDMKHVAFFTDNNGKKTPIVCSFPPKRQFLIPLEENEEIDPDCEGVSWDHENNILFFPISCNSEVYIKYYNLHTDEIKILPFMKGCIVNPKWNRYKEELFFGFSSISHPLNLYSIQIKKNDIRKITDFSNGAKIQDTIKVKSIWYKTFDRRKIHAWYLPVEMENKVPAVVLVHGGPYWQHFNSFDTGVIMNIFHMLGYACIAPNIRGSTGYGEEFKSLNQGDIGGGDLKDLIWAKKWLCTQSNIDENRIAIQGPSYGGYLTLLALGMFPNIFRVGVTMAPITDFLMTYQMSDPIYKNFFQMLLGGTPEEKPEIYRERSPLTYVESITAPLLIMVGKNDSRCHWIPIQNFCNYLKQRKHNYQLLMKEDVGHNAIDENIENQIIMWKNIQYFYEKYL